MLFNSIDFALFLPISFVLYWFVFKSNLKLQNLFLLIASYIFYGWWDWKFLSLILFSTLTDFIIGWQLAKQTNTINRKFYLFLSLSINIGLLGYFKYSNFFIQSFIDAFSFFGSSLSIDSISIVLPVGISFYTFQTISYSIDIYMNRIKPTNDFISFAAFVSFFPQLVAGPIERASNLLPQFHNPRIFNYKKSVDGLRQIIWGLFKKVVIADNCAEFANLIFNNSNEYSGITLFIGGVLFAFQIYGDFSGYSDIAIGTSRLFGFNLMQNFAFPYFSRDIAEFWRRWHISLSTWFRDYIYIPLGGSKGRKIQKVRNTFVIFIISGFWHGANWTFILWGFINALYFLPLLLLDSNRKNIGHISLNNFIPSFNSIISMLITFLLTVIAWILFRAENITHAYNYIISMILGLFSKKYYLQGIDFIWWNIGITLPILLITFICIEWIGRNNQYAIENIWKIKNKFFRWTFYYSILIAIYFLGNDQKEFIYFQF